MSTGRVMGQISGEPPEPKDDGSTEAKAPITDQHLPKTAEKSGEHKYAPVSQAEEPFSPGDTKSGNPESKMLISASGGRELDVNEKEHLEKLTQLCQDNFPGFVFSDDINEANELLFSVQFQLLYTAIRSYYNLPIQNIKFLVGPARAGLLDFNTLVLHDFESLKKIFLNGVLIEWNIKNNKSNWATEGIKAAVNTIITCSDLFFQPFQDKELSEKVFILPHTALLLYSYYAALELLEFDKNGSLSYPASRILNAEDFQKVWDEVSKHFDDTPSLFKAIKSFNQFVNDCRKQKAKIGDLTKKHEIYTVIESVLNATKSLDMTKPSGITKLGCTIL